MPTILGTIRIKYTSVYKTLSIIVYSPSYADIRSRANTTKGLDFEHMIKREHTREV
jgi:hypothetical protein